MNRVKRIIESLMVMSLLLAFSFVSAGADKDISVRSREDICDSNGAYIIIERATGETESYSVQDLLQETVTISNEYLEECAPYAYITESTVNDDLSFSAVGDRATMTFDWDIDRNTTVYSTAKMNLNVYDKVSVFVSANTSNYYCYQIGLRNNVNGVFSACSTIAGESVHPATSATWEMAVGGDFSFAIKNYNESVDSSINFTGHYTY